MTRFREHCIAWSGVALILLADSASGQRPQAVIGAQSPVPIPTAIVSTGLNTAPLNIHGPFVSSGAALAKLRATTAPRVTFSDEASHTIGNMLPPVGQPPKYLAGGGNDTGKTGPYTPLPVALGAPQANPAVVNGSAGVIDPQIAVGGNDLLVTLRNNILLFKKSDLIGKPKGASVNAQVMTSDNFFSALTADINTHLNQPPGYGVNQGYGIDPAAFPGNTYYDARAVYDNYRKRFWIIALAITQKASPSIPGTCADPVRQSARRTKVAVAVSQADDAFGAWNYYWWDANMDEDTDPRITSNKFFSHVDYPLLGISEKFLLVGNKADICQTGPGICNKPPVPACTPPDPNKQTENFTYVTVAPADALAMGTVPAGKTAAFGFKNFMYPDGTVIPPGNSLAPAVHAGPVPFGVSFFANPYVDGAGNSFLMVWFLNPANPNSPTFLYFTVPIRPLQRLNSPQGAPTAAFRGQELTVAFGENIGCTSPTTIRAIRVIRVNVLTAKLTIDTTTGRRSPNDPANIDCVSYIQPGIQINKNGDAAFVYMREDKANVPTEARYSVIYHGSLAQPPSVQLQAGTTDVGGGFDTAGISLDPDDQAIWFVAPYGSATGSKIAIGRIWGQ